MDNESDFSKHAADVKKLIEQTAITRFQKSTAATSSKGGVAVEKENALELNEDVDVEEDI